jgi:hypothetical protein
LLAGAGARPDHSISGSRACSSSRNVTYKYQHEIIFDLIELNALTLGWDRRRPWTPGIRYPFAHDGGSGFAQNTCTGRDTATGNPLDIPRQKPPDEGSATICVYRLFIAFAY